MLTVHVRKGVIGESGVETMVVDHIPGITPRQIVYNAHDRLPKEVAIDIGLNGELLDDEAYDTPLNDGDTIILSPYVTGGELLGYVVYAVIMAAVSVAINYAMGSLSPRAKATGTAQDRGDEASATYAWDGVQTNYGQGFTVPAVYGRTAVGGQVVYTSVFALSGGADRLNVLLALSEGPIYRVGDALANANSLNPIPDHIYVNNQLLTTPPATLDRTEVQLSGWNLGSFPLITPGVILEVHLGGNPTNPTLGELQVVESTNSLNTDLYVIQVSGIPPVAGVHDLRLAGNFSVFTNVNAILQITLPNPEPTANVHVRPGYLDQQRINAFPGTSVTFSPNASLDRAGQEQVYTYDGANKISEVGIVLSAPSGIFQQDNQGNTTGYPVLFSVSWRPVGDQAWRDVEGPSDFIMGATPSAAPILESKNFQLVAQNVEPPSGPLEFRVLRESAAGSTQVISSVIWRNIMFRTPSNLTYPRIAMCGIQLPTGAKFNGGIPEFRIRIDGILVRVWSPIEGWSDRTWDVPAAPFNFMQYAPGRNPAWVYVDWLTSPWGLGRYITDDDLELQSIAEWSVWCDRDPSPGDPWGEPQYVCDLAIDTPRPAWEWVLAICAAGRAAPVYRNGKIGVVYEYRDAHTAFDASFSVAAKTSRQLITSGNCESVQVTWLPKSQRPTAFLFQYLNEDQNYKQDVLPVEDPDSDMNDPEAIFREEWRPETIQAYGVNRPSQLYREGIYRHNVNRLVRRELSFVTGPWALATEVGELLDFEHELLRPFATLPLNMLVVVGGAAVVKLTIDHTDIPIGARIIVRADDGAPIGPLEVTGTTNSDGNSIVDITPATTVDAGATCVVGTADELVETYQVIAISLQRDLKREVRALQWVPAVHNEVVPGDFVPLGNDDAVAVPEVQDNPVEPTITVFDVKVEPTLSGWHDIIFGRLTDRLSVPARAYVRSTVDDVWTLAGMTETHTVSYAHFKVAETYQISVVFEDYNGDMPLPDDGVKQWVTIEEFRSIDPPAITNIEVVHQNDHVMISWDGKATADFVGYEVRVGSCWNGGRVIYSDEHNVAVISVPPAETTLMVAMVTTGGLYSQPVTLDMGAWVPINAKEFIGDDETSGTPTGTHSGTQWDSGNGWIELVDGAYAGTYTALANDATFEAPFLWRVGLDVHEVHDELLQNQSYILGSGEDRWRTVHGRAASPGVPGCDFESVIDDELTLLGDHGDDDLVQGYRGEEGAHTRALVESRYYVGGAWGAWELHQDGVRQAQQIQVRVTLERESTDYESRIPAFAIQAHL